MTFSEIGYRRNLHVSDEQKDHQMLQGSSLDRKIWNVTLDLSAQHSLVPDHFEVNDAP